MPRLSLGLGVQTIRKVGGEAPITTSRAFNSSGVQVGSTITGDIPFEWVYNETTVTSVIFANNNSVTSIGENAFQSCTGLTTITIPNSVLEIQNNAFRQSGLNTITIGNSVTSIGSYAFYQCSSLTSIAIPNSVTTIVDGYTFKDCTNLATATIGNNLTSIPFKTFENCSSLTSLTFTPTSSVTSIGAYAFTGCTSLASITIPNSVTSIGSDAFNGCSSLSSITIPNSVTSIGSYAFLGCTSLSTVTIGTSVTTIGLGAFNNNNFSSITIPSSVTSINTDAFYSCSNLATVLCYVAQSAFTGSNAFYDTASPLTIRARSTDSSWTAGTGLTFQGNANVTVIKNL